MAKNNNGNTPQKKTAETDKPKATRKKAGANAETSTPAEPKPTTELSKKDFTARFNKATKGKDLREVARQINNDFPEMKTLQVIGRVNAMAAGQVQDMNMLEAIEKL